ncbi:STM3941 family protein [Candidatus Enterococcus mansonii]|uniref:Uncharacterized protein n=1 Tax=Candidatus Enterococcus mansonii TaxID=1834181 RepID=A0A242CJY0_9ENTE|nr:STM3941 family protein [Enterococcus sp. 4G2_DIV0659]OTO10220.1 hypothetical protein A5880_000904 [Enterococcus sp. 4G2_DIV0659]
MNKDFIVYQSKGKQLLLIFLSIIMTGGSAFLLFHRTVDLRTSPYIFKIVGIVGFLFFGFCLYYFIKQFFIGKKVVVLTADGFYDYSSAIATKDLLIPWKDVVDIALFNIVGQEFISVKLKNREEFLASLSPLIRKSVQANLKLGSNEININLQNAKDVSLEELLERMLLFIDA